MGDTDNTVDDILPDKPMFVVINGQSGSGKSHLLKYLLMTRHPDYALEGVTPYKYVLAFNPTVHNGDLSEVINPKFIHREYDDKILKKFCDTIEKLGKPRCAVIFDDCLPQSGFKSQTFINFCTSYRHFNADLFINTQYPKAITPLMRSNLAFVAIFYPPSRTAADALFDAYGSHFRNKNEFYQYLVDHTPRRTFVWHDHRPFDRRNNESADQIRDATWTPMKCPEIPEYFFDNSD